MPNISIPRSRFNQEVNHASHMMHGFLTPADAVLCMPGDEFKVDMASLVRMSTPIVPFFGNIKCYVGAFFVPLRILWNDWEKLMGDPSNHDKVQSVVPVDPDSVSLPFWQDFYYPGNVTPTYRQAIESLSVRLGKPILKNGNNFHLQCKMNMLKEFAYYQIWNDHFRPSNLIEPVLLNKSMSSTGQGYCGTGIDGERLSYYHPLMQVCKNYDYFTASTLSPQFGASVQLPLGTYAPVYIENTGSSSFPTNSDIGAGALPPTAKTFDFVVPSTATTPNAKLFTDLSAATAATINSIRWAFQVQKYFERSNYGSKYFEILNAHYGITNPDSRMQRAERLGVHGFYINVNQVLSTAGQAADATQKVGQLGAVSVTGDNSNICNFAFSEFGVFMILVWTKFDRSYDGGVLREDMYSKRLDFYSPEFANLGDQATKELELHAYKSGGYAQAADIFGYNEAWAELRYRRDRVSGLLSKSSASQWLAGGFTGIPAIMDYWTLADDFEGSNVGLNKAFLFEDRAALTRVLTTGDDGPDYIVDWHIRYTKTAELPLYSIPGLIDHFGAL